MDELAMKTFTLVDLSSICRVSSMKIIGSDTRKNRDN
uniref:Uncharacterized protein n=1 Tax=Lepeophtheirus salmonis TaxID=72036 RepID=A0A0K2V340_LEPSM